VLEQLAGRTARGIPDARRPACIAKYAAQLLDTDCVNAQVDVLESPGHFRTRVCRQASSHWPNRDSAQGLCECCGTRQVTVQRSWRSSGINGRTCRGDLRLDCLGPALAARKLVQASAPPSRGRAVAGSTCAACSPRHRGALPWPASILHEMGSGWFPIGSRPRADRGVFAEASVRGFVPAGGKRSGRGNQSEKNAGEERAYIARDKSHRMKEATAEKPNAGSRTERIEASGRAT